MDANTTTKSAAPSTPPAPPAASPAAEPSGADSGSYFSKSELLAELGLSPEGPQAPADPADDSSADPAAEDAASPEAAAEAEGEAADSPPDAPAESETTEAVASSETAEAESGAPAEPKEPEKSGLQQRIDELTAARKGAEEQAARLREQLAEAQARASGALEPEVLAGVDDLPSLQAQRDRVFLLQQWAIEHPDGGAMPGKDGQPVEYSREEVARIHAQSFRLLHQDIPRRAAFLQARAQADAVALESYPWIKSVSAGYGGELQQALEQAPQLRALPGHRLMAANMLVGEKLRRAGIRVDDALIARLKSEQSGPAKPAARPVPPRAPAAPARPGSVPPRTAPRASAARSAVQALADDPGSSDALLQSIAAKLV